jgi:predicted DNA-binding transcriptional regulator AlpA
MKFEPSDLEPLKEIIKEVIREEFKAIVKFSEQDDQILDKKGLSEYLKVDVSWIDKNLYTLPHFKAGKYVRFKQSNIDKWIQGIEKIPSPYLKLMKKNR